MFIIIVLTTFKNLIFFGLFLVLILAVCIRVFTLGCPTLMLLSIAAILFVIMERTCSWVRLTLMFLVMLEVVIVVVAMVTSVVGGIVVVLVVELGVVSVGRVVILFLGKNRYLQDLGKIQAVVIVAS